jgi:hypothetical protein
MNKRWYPILLIVIPLVAAALVGFRVQPRPVAQIGRVSISSLATRVATLEEENSDLDARVSELERVVDEMLANQNGDESGEATAPARHQGLPVATATVEVAETPQAEATPEATEEATEEPTGEATDEASALDHIEIDWGPLANYFKISNVRLETQQLRDAAGRLYDVDVLAFNVESTTSFSLAIFQANFYDADGIEVENFSLVEFNPDYLGGWYPGVRSRARILVPTDMSQVAAIRFTQF